MRRCRIVVNAAVRLGGLLVLGLAPQQPEGEPFSTAIRQVKDGLYVIPSSSRPRRSSATGTTA